MNFADFTAKLEGVEKNWHGAKARCPAHDDRRASLSVGESDDGHVLVNCFAGCSAEEVVSAMGLKLSDLFKSQNVGGQGGHTPPNERATVQPSISEGVPVAQYEGSESHHIIYKLVAVSVPFQHPFCFIYEYREGSDCARLMASAGNGSRSSSVEFGRLAEFIDVTIGDR